MMGLPQDRGSYEENLEVGGAPVVLFPIFINAWHFNLGIF
jgi:hypothetical protein